MQVLAIAGWILVIGGTGFFITGALGLVRFPDLFTRLHAVTKADTAGLGMIAAGLALLSGDLVESILLLFIWAVAVGSSATSCQLLARYGCEQLDEDPSQVRKEGTDG